MSQPGLYRPKARSADPRSRGIIAFFSVILLVCLALVCMAHFSGTTMSLAQTGNQRATCDARMAAENGLAFMLYTIRTCTDITGASRGQMLFDSLEFNLKKALHGSGNLNDRTITRVGNNRLILPPIMVEKDRWFEAEMSYESHTRMRLTVTGFALNGSVLTVSRKISLDFQAQWDEALGFGVCSQGRIELGNNAKVAGSFDPSHGSLYSGQTSGEAISIGNNSEVSGSLNVRPGATIYVGNNAIIAGGQNTNAPAITMPTFSIEPYVDAVASWHTITTNSPSGNNYTNVRIPANTNPEFGNDVTINGVLYIEAPNKVSFKNKCTINGVIVGANASSAADRANCEIIFKNNAKINPPSTLPGDNPLFTEIRKLTYGSVVASDFRLELQNGATHDFGGTIAVRELEVKNNPILGLNGSILVYGTGGMKFQNNSGIRIKLATAPPPPGFDGHGLPPLAPVPSTYTEW